jgi:hypothetical protein
MDIPDRTYFWGPGMNLGVGIARAGDPDHGLPERRAGELYGEIARGGLNSASHIQLYEMIPDLCAPAAARARVA